MPMRDLRSNVPSYFERLFRAFNVKGLLPDHFAADTQLGVTIADLTADQYGWLRRETRFMWGRSVAAVAAQFSGAQLVNAPGSNVLVYDAYFTLVNTTAASVEYQVMVSAGENANLATVDVRIMSTDQRQRQGTAVQPPCVSSVKYGSDAVGVGVTGLLLNCPANGMLTVGPVVLPPNGCFVAMRNTVNTLFAGYMTWREREIEPTEF